MSWVCCEEIEQLLLAQVELIVRGRYQFDHGGRAAICMSIRRSNRGRVFWSNGRGQADTDKIVGTTTLQRISRANKNSLKYNQRVGIPTVKDSLCRCPRSTIRNTVSASSTKG
jgi:hypothetical protein